MKNYNLEYKGKRYTFQLPDIWTEEQAIDFLQTKAKDIIEQESEPIFNKAEVKTEQRRIAKLTNRITPTPEVKTSKGFMGVMQDLILNKPTESQFKELGKIAQTKLIEEPLIKYGLSPQTAQEVKSDVLEKGKKVLTTSVDTLQKAVDTALESTGISGAMGMIQKPLEHYNLLKKSGKPYTNTDLVNDVLVGLAENMPTLVKYIPALRENLVKAVPTAFSGEAGSLAPILLETIEATLPDTFEGKKAAKTTATALGIALDFYLLPKLIPSLVKETKLGKEVTAAAQKLEELPLAERVAKTGESITKYAKGEAKTPELLAGVFGDIPDEQGLVLNLAKGTKTVSEVFPKVSETIGKGIMKFEDWLGAKLGKGITTEQKAQGLHLANLYDFMSKDREVQATLLGKYKDEIMGELQKRLPQDMNEADRLEFIRYLENEKLPIPETYKYKEEVQMFKDAMDKIAQAEKEIGHLELRKGYFPHQTPEDIALGKMAGYHFSTSRKTPKTIDELMAEGKQPFSTDILKVLEHRIITSPALSKQATLKEFKLMLGKKITPEEALKLEKDAKVLLKEGKVGEGVTKFSPQTQLNKLQKEIKQKRFRKYEVLKEERKEYSDFLRNARKEFKQNVAAEKKDGALMVDILRRQGLTGETYFKEVERIKQSVKETIDELKAMHKAHIKARGNLWKMRNNALSEEFAKKEFIKEFQDVKIAALDKEQADVLRVATNMIDDWNKFVEPPFLIRTLIQPWKSMALFTQPGTWVRNAVSNKVLRFYNGVPAATKWDAVIIKNILPHTKLVNGQAIVSLPENVANKVIKLGGKDLTLQQILNEAQKRGVIENVLGMAGKTTTSQAGKNVAKMWVNLNKTMWTKVETGDKLATFMYLLDKGETFDRAARGTLRILYDYSKMPNWVKTAQEIGIPFISWYYRNCIQGIPRMLSQNMGRIAAVQKAKETWEYNVGKPLVKTDLQKQSGSYAILPTMNGLTVMWDFINYDPVVQVNLLQPTGGVVNTLKETGLNMLQLNNPFITMFAEIMANESFYYNKEIQGAVGETTNFLGVDMPPTVAYITKGLIPLAAYVDRLNPFDIFGSAYKQKPSIFSAPLEQLGFQPQQRNRQEYGGLQRLMRVTTGINWRTTDIHQTIRTQIYAINEDIEKNVQKFNGALAGKSYVKEGEPRATFDIDWKNALTYMDNALEKNCQKFVLEEMRALSYPLTQGNPDELPALYFGIGQIKTPTGKDVKITETEGIFSTLYTNLTLSRDALAYLTSPTTQADIIRDIGVDRYNQLIETYKGIHDESFTMLKSALDNLNKLPADAPMRSIAIVSEGKVKTFNTLLNEWNKKMREWNLPKSVSSAKAKKHLLVKPTKGGRK